MFSVDNKANGDLFSFDILQQLLIIYVHCLMEFQGSHGFVTTHRWNDTIGAFIDIEASGTGGSGRFWYAFDPDLSYIILATPKTCTFLY